MSIDMSMSELRAQLADALDRVEAGEVITITRHGKPVARLTPPVNSEVREHAPEAMAFADMAWGSLDNVPIRLDADGSRRVDVRRLVAETGGISQEFADELLADVRASRESR